MHISIIDDEKILANKVLKKLQSGGYSASAFYGYQDFMRHGDAYSQLYIIDISLGDGTGFDIVRWLRKNMQSTVPIIIISGYGDSQNIIYGLDIGADDYLTKPLIPDELMARVKAILRRPTTFKAVEIMRYKNITFHVDTKEVHVAGKQIYLTKNESLILELLISQKGEIVSREQLIMSVWGGHAQADVTDNSINVTLSNIRKKLEGNFMPKTFYNQGYMLEEEAKEEEE